MTLTLIGYMTISKKQNRFMTWQCRIFICCMRDSNACVIVTAPRPECTSDPECPQHLACIQEKCQNPCFTESCGIKAECKVKNHRAFCVCMVGYEGDPYTICEERKEYKI